MDEGLPTVLLISESAQEIEQFREAGLEKSWSVECCESWQAGESNLAWGAFAVVVVDLVREDGAGLEVLRDVSSLAGDVPVLVVASMTDKLSLLQAMEMGVVDFLWRGASSLDIQGRLSTAIRLNAVQLKLNHLERVDALTGTHKQDYMMELLEREFERSRRYKRPISCLLLDIDGFDEIESSCGTESTSRLLRVCSGALVEALRNVDEISRFRKSIFLVLMPETSASNSVIGLGRVREKIVELQTKVREALSSHPERASSFELTLTAGIATYPDDGLNSHADLIMAAETALYEAKRKGAGETVRADFQ